MSKNPISEMTRDQVDDACSEILGLVHDADNLSYHFLFGAIIYKMQEWDLQFRWDSDVWATYPHVLVQDQSLQVVFLRTAQALGHWSPPKPKDDATYWMSEDGSVIIRHEGYDPNVSCTTWKRVRVADWKE